jgi:DNA-binding MarR family transcriptional regulator
MDGFDAQGLDEAIHGKVRLAIMAYLSGAGAASFNTVKAATKTTDGNLSIHVRKLEDAGYLCVEKSFEGKKPLTTLTLTQSGRLAWIAYLDEIRKLIAQE